ncbi:P-loop containing nucleoside triphosphate hydrolase protein [Pluteus cervinus]|uniref:P-loop containing nucleoside triphosphate hydrolase protein n=1 Tax=Pluteus cervinus TaxID=181527 RepID=A0ACD3BEX6_9AGAR|nr:P-loop containing nucleoside triphosphate hydrolase protein [Pluteus cervinus]
MSPLLEIRNIGCLNPDNHYVFQDINLEVHSGDIIILQGKSGCGKTTLLKCMSHLRPYKGDVLLHGKTPKALGIPSYRTHVMYVPQRPSLLPGTPRDFLHTIINLRAHQTHPNKCTEEEITQQTLDIASQLHAEELLWDRDWSNLSGGESQRIALSVALGLDTAEVLLLDEPTSALDPESSGLVERLITERVRGSHASLKAVIWITHSEEQGQRVGTRFCQLTAGECKEEQRI